jgi:hypothetical protein
MDKRLINISAKCSKKVLQRCKETFVYFELIVESTEESMSELSNIKLKRALQDNYYLKKQKWQ